MGRIAAAGLTLVSILPGASVAQDGEALSAWQVEKCDIYRHSWEKALDFFGSDNLNYNFIAQNENFMASGCTTTPAVCAQSSQELEIANALNIEMMNAGAASTFLPLRCENLSTQAVTPQSRQYSAPNTGVGTYCSATVAGMRPGGKVAMIWPEPSLCLNGKIRSTGTTIAPSIVPALSHGRHRWR